MVGFLYTCLIASVIALASVSVEAQATSSALNDPVINTNIKKANPTSSPSGKSGGSCITQWGWDGMQWVKRDLVVPYYKMMIEGDHCVAVDPLTRRLVPKPTYTPVDGINTNHVLDVRWFRL